MRLDSFCRNNLLLKTKIGLITLQDASSSHLTSKLILIFEYLQLLSQTMLLDPDIYEIPNASFLDEDLLFKIVTYFCKLINPAYLLDFSKEDHFTARVLLLIFCFMLFRYLVLAEIVLKAYRNQQPNRTFTLIWRGLFRLQGRVMCYLISSFWVRTILQVSNHSFTVKGIPSGVFVGFASFLFVTEYLFSFFLETQFCDFLPNETSFLASKTYRVQIITLTQKFVLHIVQIIFKSQLTACTWVFRCISLFVCVIRDHQFFRKLPLYNIRALFYQGYLLSIITAMNLVCFIQIYLSSRDYFEKEAIQFIVIAWGIFSLLFLKIYHESLTYRMMRLATVKTKDEAEDIVNKLSVRSYIDKNIHLPGGKSQTYSWIHLLKSTQNANIQQVYNLDDQEHFDSNHLDKLNTLRQLSVSSLEKISSKNPSNIFIKLYLANLCAQDSDLYAQGIKILAELSKNPFSKYYLSSAFLLHKIERAIIHNYNNTGLNLDLYTFIKSKVSVEDLTTKMSKQAGLKIKVCQEMLQEHCDIAEIFDSAQSISKSKKDIQKEINLFLQNAPEHYIQPLLLFAEYSLVLDYSHKECKKYQSLYHKRYNKFEKYFVSPKFTEEILYQSQNIFLLVSGEKLNNGLIQYCTKSIQQLCGRPQNSYNSLHVSSLFVSGLQTDYSNFLKQIFDKGGDDRLLNKIVRSYFTHKEGYITEAYFYLRVHPYVNQHLYLCMIIRPVLSASNFLILSEDGAIDGISKHLRKIIDLDAVNNIETNNIKEISEELSKANLAFNIIKKIMKENDITSETDITDLPNKIANFAFQHHEGMKYTTALQLYSIYTSQGKSIYIQTKQSPTHKSSMFSSDHHTNNFYCFISFLPYQSSGLKLVRLEAVSKEVGLKNNQTEDSGEIEKDTSELIDSPKLVPSLPTSPLMVPQPSQSENFDSCEEERQKPIITQWNSKSPLNSERNLITSGIQTNFTRRITFALPSQFSKVRATVYDTNELSSSIPTEEIDSPKKNSPQTAEIKKAPRYLTSQHSSTSSTSDATNKPFKKALHVTSYPTTFNYFCKVFYAVMILTFGSQILLKFAADSTMEDLVIKKDMLSYVQLRAFWIVKLQINARGGALQVAGSIDEGDVTDSVRGVIVSIDKYAKNLDAANIGLLRGIDYLNIELKKRLFQNDIRVIGSVDDQTAVSNLKITNFQAIDQIMYAVHKIYNLNKSASNESLNILNYLVYNTLDDFLAKNEQITSTLTESILDQRESFESVIILCLLATPILLTAIVFVLTFIIINQYQTEKYYMETFVKLHPKGVKIALNSFSSFKSRIDNENWLQNNSQNAFGELFNTAMQQNLQIKQYNKREYDRRIKYSKMQKRYSKYIINIVFYSTLLLGIMAWNYIASTNAKDKIYRMQEQIQFANFISEKVVATYVTFVELFCSNNTNHIANHIPEPYFNESIQGVQKIQSQLLKVFSQDEEFYNPEVKTVLYEEGHCDQLTIDSSVKYCQTMATKGLLTAIAPSLAKFEELMQAKLAAYESVKMTTQENIYATALINIDQSIMTSTVLSSKAQLITSILSESLSAQINSFYEQRTLIIMLFLLSLSAAGFLFWFQILVKIREVNNDFKRVLLIFPADFVLSSFLLKSFIKDTTKGFYNI